MSCLNFWFWRFILSFSLFFFFQTLTLFILDVDRFNIKETFEAQGNAVSFVEVMESEGDGPKTGVVRMSTGEGATDTVKKLTEDKVEVGGFFPFIFFPL